MDVEHVVITHRRSLAERCYHLWREAPASNQESRELFFVQCSCGTTAAIRQELCMTDIKTVFWTPRDVAANGPCLTVAKVIADEFPAALEAMGPESLPVKEQHKLWKEFQAQIERETWGGSS